MTIKTKLPQSLFSTVELKNTPEGQEIDESTCRWGSLCPSCEGFLAVGEEFVQVPPYEWVCEYCPHCKNDKFRISIRMETYEKLGLTHTVLIVDKKEKDGED